MQLSRTLIASSLRSRVFKPASGVVAILLVLAACQDNSPTPKPIKSNTGTSPDGLLISNTVLPEPVKDGFISMVVHKPIEQGQATDALEFRFSRAADDFLVVDYTYKASRLESCLDNDESLTVWLSREADRAWLYQFVPIASGHLSFGEVQVNTHPTGLAPLDAATSIGISHVTGSIRAMTGRAVLKLPQGTGGLSIAVAYWSRPSVRARGRSTMFASSPQNLSQGEVKVSEFRPMDYAALPVAADVDVKSLLAKTAARAPGYQFINSRVAELGGEANRLASITSADARVAAEGEIRSKMNVIWNQAGKQAPTTAFMDLMEHTSRTSQALDVAGITAIVKQNPWLISAARDAEAWLAKEKAWKQYADLCIALLGVLGTMEGSSPAVTCGVAMEMLQSSAPAKPDAAPHAARLIEAIRPLVPSMTSEHKFLWVGLRLEHALFSGADEKAIDALLDEVQAVVPPSAMGIKEGPDAGIRACTVLFNHRLGRGYMDAKKFIELFAPLAAKRGWKKQIVALAIPAMINIIQSTGKFADAREVLLKAEELSGNEADAEMEMNWQVARALVRCMTTNDIHGALREGFARVSALGESAAKTGKEILASNLSGFLRDPTYFPPENKGFQRTMLKAQFEVFIEQDMWLYGLESGLFLLEVLNTENALAEAVEMCRAIETRIEEAAAGKKIDSREIDAMRTRFSNLNWEVLLASPDTKQEDINKLLSPANDRLRLFENFRRSGDNLNSAGVWMRFMLSGKDAEAQRAFTRVDAALKVTGDAVLRLRLNLFKADVLAGIGSLADAEATLKEAATIRTEIPSDALRGIAELQFFDLIGAQVLARSGDFAKAASFLDERLKQDPSTIWADILRHSRELHMANATAWQEELALRAKEPANLPRVLLKTTAGEIELVLFEDDAPQTVANFLHLAELKTAESKGYYEGVKFHRLATHFVVQGGCPKGTGAGSPGWSIKNEAKRQHLRGRIAMARSGHPDSAGSQFYFILEDSQAARSLDSGRYTVFGRVVRGLDVMDKLRIGHVITEVKVLSKRDHEYRFEKLEELR